jgi:hypothetical protein
MYIHIFTETHVECQEQALVLARQQLLDLLDHRMKMNKESESINEGGKRQVYIYIYIYIYT